MSVGLLVIAIGAFAFAYDDLFVTSEGGVAFREIARGERSAVTIRKNYLIASPSDYALLWRMLDAQGEPPEIDFETESVLAVFAGRQSTAGYEIRVKHIEDETARKVLLAFTKPNENCLTAQAIIEPYQIVVVPKTTLGYVHEDEVVKKSCL